MSRKTGVLFEPQLVIEEVKSEVVGRRTFKPREEYLQRYLEVSALCLKGVLLWKWNPRTNLTATVGAEE